MSRTPKPPAAPSPLAAMGERKKELEADRAAIFKTWRAALKEAQGNITAAATALDLTKSRGQFLTKSLGLRAYAAELRVAAGGTLLGRQWKTEKNDEQ